MKNLVLVTLITIIAAIAAVGQTTEFTYQGTLKDGANPANGNYDLEFRLFDASTGGSQHPTIVTRANVAVTNGTFDVTLDFFSPLIAAFPGADRYLEIRVRNAGGVSFTLLTPRQKLGSTPYAQKSINSETANNATSLGGVAASQYLTTAVGGTAFIQNSTSPQASSNFNISGNGTVGGTLSAGVVNATTQFNIGNERVLSATGLNTLLGVNAGVVSTGLNNAFLGASAGAANTTGSSNTFVGSLAGERNTSGNGNSFFGRAAGSLNTTGGNNTFFGAFSGDINTTGVDNTFVGYRAGKATSVGTSNTFVGSKAGQSNTSAIANTFVGFEAGQANTIGATNSFFGYSAGANNDGYGNVFVGYFAGSNNTTGERNVFVGHTAGMGSLSGYNNTAVGYQAGRMSFDSVANLSTAIGSLSEIDDGVVYATAIGAQSRASISNSIILGRTGGEDTVRIPGSLIITGSTTVNGNFVMGSGGAATFFSPVTLSASGLGTAGGTSLCRNASFQIANCSSSLRYKTNVNPSWLGLDLVKQLKPVTFDWKQGGMHDLGLGAEDVAAIEPLLVTYNAKGEVEGVKYDRIGVVLVNAVKEQQGQIDTLKKQIEILTNMVCATNTNADICKEK